MSLINREIVDFKVQAYVNNDFKEVTKQDVLGKWSVFFFYPADFTFVCPTELEDLANKYEDFKKIGCEIYSVSCDTHFVHKAWHDVSKTIQKLQYPMLADPTAVLARGFDVLIEEDGLAERGWKCWTKCRGAFPPCAGITVCRRTRRSGVSCKVAAGRGDAEAES